MAIASKYDGGTDAGQQDAGALTVEQAADLLLSPALRSRVEVEAVIRRVRQEPSVPSPRSVADFLEEVPAAPNEASQGTEARALYDVEWKRADEPHIQLYCERLSERDIVRRIIGAVHTNGPVIITGIIRRALAATGGPDGE